MSPFDASELYRDAAFARRLALRLVREAGEAEDVVQEAWRTVLERPPRHGASPRGYLATVVRRLALRRRRGDARREERERAVARREPVPSAAALVARMELHRRVVSAVMELDEPYRTTLLLRFFEDLPPAAVAERQGVPVETVRTRLRRGLARLRATLEPERSDERREWLSALALLAAPERAARPEAAATASSLGVPALFGALVGFAVLAGTALLAWLAVRSGDGRAGEGARAPAGERTVAVRGGEAASTPVARRALAGARAPGPAATVLAARAADGPFVLRGRVHDAGGLGIAGALVDVVAWTTDPAGDEAGRAVTAADGSYEAELARLAELSVAERSTVKLDVRVSAPGFHPLQHEVALRTEPGPTLALDVELAPGPSLELRIVDEAGRAVPGSLGLVSVRGPDGDGDSRDAFATNGRGVLRLGLPVGGEVRDVQGWMQGVGAGRLEPDELAAARREGDVLVLAPLVLRRGARIAGSVSYPDGAPARMVPVNAWRVRWDEAGGWTYDAGFGVEDGGLSRQFGRTDDEGRFEIVGLRPGSYVVSARTQLARPELDPERGPVDALLVRTGEDDVALVVELHRLLLSIAIGDGRRLEGARVAFTPLARGPDGAWGAAGSTVRSWTKGDPPRAGYRAEPGTRVAVSAFVGGAPPLEEVVVVPARPFELEHVLVLPPPSEPAALVVRSAELPEGSALRVRLATPIAGLEVGEPHVGVTGAVLAGLPPGLWRVEVDPLPAAGEVDCHPPLRLPEPVELLPGATREVSVAATRGGPLELAFALPGAPPPASDELRHPPVESEQSWVTWTGGAPVHARLERIDDDGERAAVLELPDAIPGGRWRSPGALPAGRYLLRAGFPGHLPVEQWLDVAACRANEVVVSLAAAPDPR